ncbi:uncharacterized protein LOC123009155 [Tribolium madens]|uniref:uncharacterized protein LOC123009155 n=1 Tax=Tribolium madens TaxID=41895 RepID=UPI001CF72BEB|nr:uncharacterized protein LOC123009155 [Tribolium madens]
MGFLLEDSWTEVLLLSAILTLLVLHYFHNAYKYWEQRGVPTIKPTFPLGNGDTLLPEGFSVGMLSRKFYEELKKRGEKFGGVYLVTQPNLVLVDPEYVKDILATDFQYFVDRGFYYNEKTDPLSAHLFALDGTSWRNLRIKLTPTFTSGKMKMMFKTVVECCGYMRDAIGATLDRDLDIKDILSRYTTDVIGSCAFGIECNSFKYPDAEFRKMGKKVFSFGFWRSFCSFCIIYFPKLSHHLGVPTNEKDVQNFFTGIVAESVKLRQEQNIKRNDFLQLLIDLKDHLSLGEMAAQVFLFFAAGFESSSTTMTFVLYELAKNAEVQEKLRIEIRKILDKHQGLTYEAIIEMKYLQQVIDETLRLYPPLATLNRRCIKDYTLRNTNIKIEKGTSVIIPSLGLHMDPEFYPDPEIFNPENFSEENKQKRPNFVHLPFGDGPRNCIGLRFALMQSKSGIATVINHFRLSVSPATKPLKLNPHSFILNTFDKIYLRAEKLAQLKSRRPFWTEIPHIETCNIKDEWRRQWSNLKIFNKNLVEDPTLAVPGMDQPRWCNCIIRVKMSVFTELWLEIFLLFTLFFLILINYFNYCYQYWSKKGVPTIKPRFPLGNTNIILPQGLSIGTLSKHFYDEFKAKGHKCGGVYLVTQPNLVVVDPEYVKDIMSKDFQHFVDRGFYYNKKNDVLSAHLFAIDGSDWRNLRIKLTPTFTSGKMKMMFESVVECSKHMIQALGENPGVDVEIKEVLGRFTTDVIGTCAFGIQCNSFKYPDAEFRMMGKKIFEYDFWKSIKAFFSINTPKVALQLGLTSTPNQVIDFFTKIVTDAVKMREENNIKRNDFLQILIDLKNTTSLTVDEMSAQVFLFFVAGFETSSTTMTFALYELAKNEEMQTKLRHEICQILAKNDHQITYEALKEMKYLQQIIDETLRKYPPLPTLNRRCTKDYTLRGTDIIIEKGTPVLISALGLHMDPEFYPDPEKFDPERFTEEKKKERHPFVHLPFGDGPRNCIGLRFGVMQSKIGIITIIKKFKLTVSPNMKPVVFNPYVFLLNINDKVYLRAEKL